MSKITRHTGKMITVEIPKLNYPGSNPQSHFWLSASKNLTEGYVVGGGAVKEAIAAVLKQIGAELLKDEE